jgi:hypothetical protein|nr:hypothetical protein [Nicotiana tabacum]
MRDQETDREGMAYQSLVDLPLNQSRSSQLSCLGSGIPSLVGGFDSKKCGAGSSLSTSSGSREGDRGDPDFRSLLYGGSFRIKSVLGRPGKMDWIERRCLCLFFIDRIPIIFSLRRRRQGRGTEHVLPSTSIRH